MSGVSSTSGLAASGRGASSHLLAATALIGKHPLSTTRAARSEDLGLPSSSWQAGAPVHGPSSRDHVRGANNVLVLNHGGLTALGHAALPGKELSRRIRVGRATKETLMPGSGAPSPASRRRGSASKFASSSPISRTARRNVRARSRRESDQAAQIAACLRSHIVSLANRQSGAPRPAHRRLLADAHYPRRHSHDARSAACASPSPPLVPEPICSAVCPARSLRRAHEGRDVGPVRRSFPSSAFAKVITPNDGQCPNHPAASDHKAHEARKSEPATNRIGYLLYGWTVI